MFQCEFSMQSHFSIFQPFCSFVLYVHICIICTDMYTQLFYSDFDGYQMVMNLGANISSPMTVTNFLCHFDKFSRSVCVFFIPTALPSTLLFFLYNWLQAKKWVGKKWLNPQLMKSNKTAGHLKVDVELRRSSRRQVFDIDCPIDVYEMSWWCQNILKCEQAQKKCPFLRMINCASINFVATEILSSTECVVNLLS